VRLPRGRRGHRSPGPRRAVPLLRAYPKALSMICSRQTCPPLGAVLMPDSHEQTRRDWRIPDALWERIAPLLPPRKPHPLGCHRPRVDDRKAMDAIFFVLRTGCQWNALNETGICSSSAAHRRFQEWTEADVFVALWEQGLVE